MYLVASSGGPEYTLDPRQFLLPTTEQAAEQATAKYVREYIDKML